MLPAQGSGYQGNFLPFVAATVAINTQVSNNIALNGFGLCGIFFPAAIISTALTFYAGNSDQSIFRQIYNSAGAVSYTVAGQRYIAINPQDFYGVQFLQIHFGSVETTALAFTLALKGL